MKIDLYTKTFDDSYAQFREAQILGYLNQRNAPVPKLLSNDLKSKKLEMSYTGESLEKNLDQNDFNRNLNIILGVINLCEGIYNLKVLQLDISLGNITLNNTGESSKFKLHMIDFGASISQLFPLQKPLWLKPDKALHHPYLLAALAEDWENFFKYLGTSPPNFEDEFDVCRSAYDSFWSKSFNVERISNEFTVIVHNLAFFIQDFLSSHELGNKMATQLQLEVDILKNNANNDQAKRNLFECSQNIARMLKSNGGSVDTPKPVFAGEIPIRESRFGELTSGRDLVRKMFFRHSDIFGCICMLISFHLIDQTYVKEGLTLTDLGFYFGIGAILLILVLPILILFGSTKSRYALVKRSLICIQIYFIFELFYIGATWTSLLSIAGLSLMTCLFYSHVRLIK